MCKQSFSVKIVYLDQELAGPGVGEEVGIDEPAADGEDQRQDDGDGSDAKVVILA
jgi:hypothetical protein